MEGESEPAMSRKPRLGEDVRGDGDLARRRRCRRLREVGKEMGSKGLQDGKGSRSVNGAILLAAKLAVVVSLASLYLGILTALKAVMKCLV